MTLSWPVDVVWAWERRCLLSGWVVQVTMIQNRSVLSVVPVMLRIPAFLLAVGRDRIE